MIVQFWLGALLLLIIAGVGVVFPFIAGGKKITENETKRNRLNRDLYDVRLAELEREEQQGLILDKQKIISELQHNLLDDIIEQQPAEAYKKNRCLWLPGLFVLIVGSVTLYWWSASYRQLENWQSVLQRYPALQSKLFDDAGNRPSEQDLQDIMLGLRTHLSTHSDDADGWLLYGRLAMLFNDVAQAMQAVQKAYSLAPGSTAVRLFYIRLNMQRGDAYAAQKARAMLLELLKEQPKELDAWSMYALLALQKQDYGLAVQRWQKMLPLVAEGSEQARVVHENITYAINQMLNLTKATAAPEPSATGQGAVAEPDDGYQVDVAIAPQAGIPEHAFLFVYATPLDSPVPIAALKIAVASFPVSVKLSDVNSMIGEKLSAHPAFIIKAGLSADGSARAGKWQGQSAVITSGAEKRIKLSIWAPR